MELARQCVAGAWALRDDHLGGQLGRLRHHGRGRDLAREIGQALQATLDDARDDVDAGPTRVRATGMAAHAVGDEVEAEVLVDEVRVLVVGADAAHVGDRPGTQAHCRKAITAPAARGA